MPEHSQNWEVAVQQAQAKILVYEEMFARCRQGQIGRKIKSELGITGKTLKRWSAGELPEEIERLQRISSTNHLKAPNLPFGKMESVEVAELIGAFQAATRLSDSRTTVHVSYSDIDTAERVKALVESWQVTEKVKIVNQRGDRRGRFGVVIYSRALFRSLMELTDDNNKIPWHILGTDREICGYLKSFFSTIGSLHKGKFYLESARHPELGVGIAFLLEHLGIPADIITSPKMGFSVTTPYGVGRMRDLKLLAPRHYQSLEQFPLKGDLSEYPGKLFLDALLYHKRNPHAGVAEIARAVNAGYTSVIGWRDGQVPVVIRGRQHIREWAEKFGIPNPGVVAFLYRNFDVPILECEKIGVSFTLPEIKTALGTLKKGSFDIQRLKTEDLKGLAKPCLSAAQRKKFETW